MRRAACMLAAFMVFSGTAEADSNLSSHPVVSSYKEEVPKTGDDMLVPVAVMFIMSAVCIHFCIRSIQPKSCGRGE